MRGSAEVAKGRVKEAAGALTGNDKLRTEGRADQAVGHVKQTGEKGIRKAKKSARKSVDKAKDIAQKGVDKSKKKILETISVFALPGVGVSLRM